MCGVAYVQVRHVLSTPCECYSLAHFYTYARTLFTHAYNAMNHHIHTHILTCILTCILNRIKARLNNFRVPVDTSVRLTFARRLVPDVDDDEPLSPLSSPNPSPRPVSTFTSFESFNEKNDHVNNANEVNSPAADLSQHCNDKQEEKESSEKFNDMDGDMYDIDESVPDVTPEKESMVQECEQEKDASVLVTQCESSTPEHAKEEQRTGASTSNDNTNSSTFVHHLDLADSLMNEPPPDTNCVDNNAHIDIDENDCEVEDADREDYERQEPVEIAEHRNVVFKDTFDDNLRCVGNCPCYSVCVVVLICLTL